MTSWHSLKVGSCSKAVHLVTVIEGEAHNVISVRRIVQISSLLKNAVALQL